MMTQNPDKKREQIVIMCMDDLVPQDHMLRKIDRALRWDFIYDLVEDKYSPDQHTAGAILCVEDKNTCYMVCGFSVSFNSRKIFLRYNSAGSSATL